MRNPFDPPRDVDDEEPIETEHGPAEEFIRRSREHADRILKVIRAAKSVADVEAVRGDYEQSLPELTQADRVEISDLAVSMHSQLAKPALAKPAKSKR